MNATTVKLKSWFQDKKDNSVSYVLETLLRKKLERYGSLLEFRLDSRHGTASVKLVLKGDPEPVTVWIDGYQLVTGSDGSGVAVTSARASREWLTLAIEDFLLGKSFPIPPKYAGYVKMIL